MKFSCTCDYSITVADPEGFQGFPLKPPSNLLYFTPSVSQKFKTDRMECPGTEHAQITHLGTPPMQIQQAKITAESVPVASSVPEMDEDSSQALVCPEAASS